MTFIFIIFVSFYVSLLIFAAMSGWYLCADLTSAVDAYDVLGVEPGPADAQHTPLQRIMALSQVRSKRLTECYNSTIQHIGENSTLAQCAMEAYGLLSGSARSSYDMKLLKGSVEVRCCFKQYSICIKIAFVLKRTITFTLPAPFILANSNTL